ncbi:MAG: SDR family oxidoreductase [Ignavibacteria bacterium]|nr:SDR family oxidoreductase [Ignavibacteria bacterium]MBI3766393.1 SDR family oxidoreductase [Ignavibacteriales bacterium]
MSSSTEFSKSTWALILGASSGFGAATALELARRGMNIIGVHFDRAVTMPNVERLMSDIKSTGSKTLFFNINASDAAKRAETIDAVKKEFAPVPDSTIRVLLHSLAFGTLKPYIGKKSQDAVSQAQMEMTLDVMANSLVYWTQAIVHDGLMKQGGRIFAMTSSGGHSVLPNYGAVSAAKAALESHIRQLAMELGHRGITANSVLAGVTNTPALQKIPGAVSMLNIARAKNPQMRTTTPEDVARAIALLSRDDASFISGNVIGVDAGEDIVSYIGQKNAVELE